MATMLFKVFTLTLKTVSKPLASRFEGYVMGHPVLRDKVVRTAQWLHSLEVSISRGAEGKTGRVFVGDMSEERAMQMASKVASEGFVYGTALILLVLEMYRKDKEDKEKKRKQEEEKRRRHETDARLEKELIEVREVLAKMEERLDAHDALHDQRSWWQKDVVMSMTASGDSTLTPSVTWQLVLATILAVVGGMVTRGPLKPIRVADSPSLTGEYPEFRDFLSSSTRGSILGALLTDTNNAK